jgi:hypothetical protein
MKLLENIYWSQADRQEDKFDKLTLMTNATLLPTQAEIDALKQYGKDCIVLISDYGRLSYKKQEFQKMFEENGMSVTLKPYHGEDQHFGGWIDNSGLKRSDENDEIISERAAKCPQVKIENMHCHKGKLHRCSNSCFMSALGVVVPAKEDFVDLNDATVSMEAKRNIIRGFYQSPRASCRYCVWSNADTRKMPRYPAAEQVG